MYWLPPKQELPKAEWQYGYLEKESARALLILSNILVLVRYQKLAVRLQGNPVNSVNPGFLYAEAPSE